MRLRGPLLPGEQVIAATRSHVSFLLPSVFFGFFAVMFFSFASVVYASTTFFGFLGYLGAAVLCWLMVRRAWSWAATGYIITSQRLVIQRAFGLSRSVSIPLNSIEGVDAHHPLCAMGQSMRLSVHSRGTVYVLRQVPYGDSFSGEVAQAQGSFFRSQYGAGYGQDGIYSGGY